MTLLVAFSLAACGKSNNQGNESSTNNSTSNSTAATANSSNTGDLTGTLLASGSTALQPLVDQVSKKFLEKNPAVSLQVQGGGSGTGLTQVSEGQSQIGNSDVFAEEKLEADKAKELVDHQVAVVAMATVVNPKINVDNLTKQQLVDIFSGKITNWKDLGADDQAITIVNRPSSSGTRATFEKYALGTKVEDIRGSIQEDSSGTVKKLISETPGAIGYLALSYLDDSIKTVKYEGVEAKEDNIVDGSYPVWAYEHMYTKGEPDAAGKAFLDYMMSDEVQNGDVVDLGYIPANKMKVKRDAAGNISK